MRISISSICLTFWVHQGACDKVVTWTRAPAVNPYCHRVVYWLFQLVVGGHDLLVFWTYKLQEKKCMFHFERKDLLKPVKDSEVNSGVILSRRVNHSVLCWKQQSHQTYYFLVINISIAINCVRRKRLALQTSPCQKWILNFHFKLYVNKLKMLLSHWPVHQAVELITFPANTCKATWHFLPKITWRQLIIDKLKFDTTSYSTTIVNYS